MLMNPYPVAEIIHFLKTCIKKKEISAANEMYTLICKYGMENNEDIGNHLVPMLVECGLIVDAQCIFDRLTHRNAHSWTYLISGYVDNGEHYCALQLYSKMQFDHVEPNSHTFAALLKACSCLKVRQEGHGIHTAVVKKGFEQDLFVSGALVDMYGRWGFLQEALVIFESLTVWDVVLWNALMKGYVEHGEDLTAVKFFDCMCYHNIPANVLTLCCMLKASGNLGDIENGQRFYDEIVMKGFDGDLFVSSNLIEMQVLCNNLHDAQNLLDRLPFRNSVIWNQLIAKYAEYGHCNEVMRCLEMMRQEGVVHDSVTMACLVKFSVNVEDVNMGLETHKRILEQGVEGDVFLGSTLIDMYMKFGLRTEALVVFSKLLTRNVVSWNVLITGYAEYGPVRSSFEFFERMVEEGATPNVLTLIGILKACKNGQSVKDGQHIHAQILLKGFDRNHSVCNALIDMYGNCGMLLEANIVFMHMSSHCIVSWNVLISGYVDQELNDEVITCFEKMEREGISQDAVTFSLILKACGSNDKASKGREMHSRIIKSGFENDHIVNSILIDMYIKWYSVSEAQHLFRKLAFHTLHSWNSLIVGYSECERGMDVLEALQHMQSEGFHPTVGIYAAVLNACGMMNDIRKVHEKHMEIIKIGFESDLSINSTLVGVYEKCAMIGESQYCVAMSDDVDVWNALLKGYADNGRCKEVLSTSEQMQQKVSYKDVVTSACVLKACATLKLLEKGRHVYMTAIKHGFDRDIFLANTSIDFYMKCGFLKEAKRVFDDLPTQNVVSFNCLIAGYVELGFEQNALNCMESMHLQGVTPNQATFLLIMKACSSKVGAVDKACGVHQDITRMGLELDCFIGSTLVDVYIKHSLFQEARRVFYELPARNNVAWNAMIKGYGMNHEGSMAIELFNDMCAQGLKPDHITFTCLLTACSRASLVAEGQRLFNMMKDAYGVTPCLDHIFCIADLLARSGKVEEAGRYLNTVPSSPSEDMWAALLGACSTYHEGKLGSRCFGHLV